MDLLMLKTAAALLTVVAVVAIGGLFQLPLRAVKAAGGLIRSGAH